MTNTPGSHPTHPATPSMPLPSPPPKPRGAFRILHFSDIHVGIPDWSWRYLLDKRCLGRLNQALSRQGRLSLDLLEGLPAWSRETGADAVLCTGDLTSIGSPEEFRRAEAFLTPLRDAYGKNFLYVPGNHDAYVPGSLPPLRDTFRALNQGLELADLPLARPLGPLEVVLLSPAIPCAPWLSHGAMPACDWDKLGYILHSPCGGAARLVACHFPLLGAKGNPLFWRSRLVGWERLLQWGREGLFQAYCAGHVHRPFLLPPHQGAPWLVGAGSLTLHSSCSVLDFQPEDGTFTPYLLQRKEIP